jgi:hypothetical protein
LFGRRLQRRMMFQDTICGRVLASRESGSDFEEKGKGVEASRLRRNPRLLFANAVNVEDHVGRATFRLVASEEGRAESSSLSEDVNLEDDDQEVARSFERGFD